jgi:hypothetical protein
VNVCTYIAIPISAAYGTLQPLRFFQTRGKAEIALYMYRCVWYIHINTCMCECEYAQFSLHIVHCQLKEVVTMYNCTDTHTHTQTHHFELQLPCFVIQVGKYVGKLNVAVEQLPACIHISACVCMRERERK